MTITVNHIYRYPVKGLSPESLDGAPLTPGEGLPADRRYAIARESGEFDVNDPKWVPKVNFVMLAKNPKLAKLRTRFDAKTGWLRIERGGKQVAAGNLSLPIGRAMIAEFIKAFLGDDIQGMPSVVEAPGHMFSDHRNKVLSLFSLASIRDLERVTGHPVEPVRFRANLILDGLARPWEEFTWIGKTLAIGGARLEVTARIDRCAATNANPETGEVDANIPQALRRGFGHIDFGVYAKVIEGGEIKRGDAVTVGESA